MPQILIDCCFWWWNLENFSKLVYLYTTPTLQISNEANMGNKAAIQRPSLTFDLHIQALIHWIPLSPSGHYNFRPSDSIPENQLLVFRNFRTNKNVTKWFHYIMQNLQCQTTSVNQFINATFSIHDNRTNCPKWHALKSITTIKCRKQKLKDWF